MQLQKQQEDTTIQKLQKATKASKLDNFCQILTQNQSKPTKKFAF